MPYPTPSPSPPASMLAVSIRGIQDEIPKAGIPKAGTFQIHRTESWEAAFLAGSRSGTAGKVNNKVISKAQLERLLRKPLALHRRDLPPPPTKHSDLEKHPMGHLFEQAEMGHLKSHEIMKSWLEINSRDPKVKGHRVLDCKWVYVYKFDKHSRFLKTKARLVVRGDQQARSLTENTLVAIAARFDLELIQYDAVNAFVHAELDDDVFMKMPPGHRTTGTILKLNKALYGLRKSPLLWQKELTRSIRKLGFEPVPHLFYEEWNHYVLLRRRYRLRI
jgi:Reverse transcriptase (RNA-dependent DNA polymerase)